MSLDNSTPVEQSNFLESNEFLEHNNCLWNGGGGCVAPFAQNGVGALCTVIEMGRKPSVTSLSPRCHTDTGGVGSLQRPSASCQPRVHIHNKNVMPTEAMGTFESDAFKGRVCHNKCLGVGRRIRERVCQLLFKACRDTWSTKLKQERSQDKNCWFNGEKCNVLFHPTYSAIKSSVYPQFTSELSCVK